MSEERTPKMAQPTAKLLATAARYAELRTAVPSDVGATSAVPATTSCSRSAVCARNTVATVPATSRVAA